MMEMLEKTAVALERRHFKAAVFKTAQEAAAFILSDMPDGASRCVRRKLHLSADGAGSAPARKRS